MPHVHSAFTDSDGNDDQEAPPTLASLYAELRRMAGAVLRGSRASLTLQPTELVHEHVIRFLESLPQGVAATPQDLREFARNAFAKMRFELLDHIRKHDRRRRRRVPLTLVDVEGKGIDVPDIERFTALLQRLADHQPDWATALQCRLFFERSVAETAQSMAVSERTVARYQAEALNWLREQLTGSDGPLDAPASGS